MKGATDHSGFKLASFQQMASEWDVSVGTITLAVSDLVRAGILSPRRRRGTVLAEGCDLQRVRLAALGASGAPEPSAEPTPSSSPLAGRSIHLVIPGDDVDGMSREIMSRIHHELAGHQCVVTEVSQVRHSRRPLDLRQYPCDGLVVFSTSRHFKADIADHQVLLILTTALHPVDLDGRYDQLTVDDEHGSYLAGKHLRRVGCRSVAFIGRHHAADQHDRYDAVSVRRLNGFERGWGETIPSDHLLFVDSYDAGQGAAMVAGYMAMQPRPQAIFAASDEVAIGFMLGARAHGLLPRRDYQLVGFDKQQIAMDCDMGPLTTVEVPREAMAQRGAELLAARMAEPDQPVRRVFIGCSLFEGRTVRHPAK